MEGGEVEATIKVKGGDEKDVTMSQNDSKLYYSNRVAGGEVEATIKVKGGDGKCETKSQNESKIYYSNKVAGGEVEATIIVKGGDVSGKVTQTGDSKVTQMGDALLRLNSSVTENILCEIVGVGTQTKTKIVTDFSEEPKTSIENTIVFFETNKKVLDSVKGDSNGERKHYKDSSVKIVPEKVDVKCGELEFENEHQRHLSNAILNSTKMKTTIKGRVEEIERRTFTDLHRGTQKR